MLNPTINCCVFTVCAYIVNCKASETQKHSFLSEVTACTIWTGTDCGILTHGCLSANLHKAIALTVITSKGKGEGTTLI